MAVYGRGRRLGLGTVPMAMVLAAVGCSSEPDPKDVALAQKDQQIQGLEEQIAQEREHALQIEADAEVANARVSAMEQENGALKQALTSKDQLVAEKARLAEVERQRAEEAKKRADAAQSAPRYSAAPAAPSGRSSGSEESPKSVGGEKSVGGKYHLRIISLPKNEPNEQAIQEIAGHLKKMDVPDVVPRQSGNHWVIDIGFFGSTKAPEAEALKQKLTTMKFQGVRQFESAYFVTY